MSATLTWYNSGLQAKTGTTVAATWTDLDSLMASRSADANFSWTKSSSNTGSSPRQITMKPKSGAAGRIMFIQWDSAPGANNSAILAGAPATTTVYACYFPAGNVDTPSNLTAGSGTIMGDDTGCIGATSLGGQTTLYGASIQWFYFDSAEAIILGAGNPGTASSTYISAVGNILVDGSDVAYAGILGNASTVWTPGAQSSPGFAWTVNAAPYPTSTQVIKTNYGSTGRSYYVAYAPNGAWGSTVIGANDILSNTSTTDVYFVPLPLVGNTKGEGFVLKLRQICAGPCVTGAFTVYNTTGPVPAAQSPLSATGGASTGHPWTTNFKV